MFKSTLLKLEIISTYYILGVICRIAVRKKISTQCFHETQITND